MLRKLGFVVLSHKIRNHMVTSDYDDCTFLVKMLNVTL